MVKSGRTLKGGSNVTIRGTRYPQFTNVSGVCRAIWKLIDNFLLCNSGSVLIDARKSG